MYFIDRITLTSASFVSGLAEPSATEAEWVSGASYAVGTEVIRSALHRVFKCAATRSPATTPASTTAPEDDPTGWQDMRATQRWLPFGPVLRANGQTVYEAIPLVSTTADIDYRIKARYANAIALIGMGGSKWYVDVYRTGDATPRYSRAGGIKRPARGYWDYAMGKRRLADRVLLSDLPMYPDAEVRVRITGGSGATRRLAQCEIGQLRRIGSKDWGGTEYGLTRSPRAFTYQKQAANGGMAVLIYGTTYNLSGAVSLLGTDEDDTLQTLRDLIGKCVVYVPTLQPGYAQSMCLGVLTSAPTTRDSFNLSGAKFEIDGLPT